MVAVWALFAPVAKIPAQAKPAKSATAAAKTGYYYDPIGLNLAVLVPPPPAPDSAAYKAELADLHRIDETRTPTQVAAAKADEDNESLFLFQGVLGPNFSADALPLTADLGKHVKNEQSVAGSVLKAAFFAPAALPDTDKTLHPVCALKPTHPIRIPAGMH